MTNSNINVPVMHFHSQMTLRVAVASYYYYSVVFWKQKTVLLLPLLLPNCLEMDLAFYLLPPLFVLQMMLTVMFAMHRVLAKRDLQLYGKLFHYYCEHWHSVFVFAASFLAAVKSPLYYPHFPLHWQVRQQQH